MSEWWTYRPADFLMFAPRTYWRLFELHNQAWWPAQPLLLLAGLGWIAWRLRAGTAALRTACIGLAVAWAVVACAFLWQRYTPINWAVPWAVAGFGVGALALALVGARGGLRAATGLPQHVGTALCAWAVAVHPWLAMAAGRDWRQAEVIGLAPDPTAIATLGVLLATRPGARWLRSLALVLAGLWCVLSAATLWTMNSAQGWVPAAAVLVTLLAGQQSRESGSRAADRP
jgi:hypothetical protein